jgi:4-alpha-glucanotransferase
MPLYVALDSVDVWVEPTLYKLDKNFIPKKVAGVPPDYFCADGQLWGNPVYDYSKHKKQGYKWWADRIASALQVFDYVRIDHFRGLDRYFEIEYGAPNAREGKWVNVPSKALFSAIHKVVDKSRIIAEDLGIIDDGVRALLKHVGYPGMKILSFAFNGEPNNLYLPERLPKNSICYTGTHDNDTLLGLISSASDWDKGNLYNGVRNSLYQMGIDMAVNNDLELHQAIIELGYASDANLFLIPLQDLLGQGSEWRINEPSTIKAQNWAIKFRQEHFSLELSKILKQLTLKYNR